MEGDPIPNSKLHLWIWEVLSWEGVVLYPKNHGISTSHWWGLGDPRPRPLAILTHPGPNPSISSQGYGSVMVLRPCVLCCRVFAGGFFSTKNHGPQGFCSAKFSAKFTGFTTNSPKFKQKLCQNKSTQKTYKFWQKFVTHKSKRKILRYIQNDQNWAYLRLALFP